MSEEMLSVDQIRDRIEELTGTIWADINLKEVVRLIRQGMMEIPVSKYPPNLDYPPTKETWIAAQAALLADPLVIDLRGVEWPENSSEIWVGFIQGGEFGKIIKTVSRPVPAWIPNPGDPVFINRGDDVAEVAKFCQVGESRLLWVITTIKGQDQGHKPKNVKPFDPSKIGMPWREI